MIILHRLNTRVFQKFSNNVTEPVQAVKSYVVCIASLCDLKATQINTL